MYLLSLQVQPKGGLEDMSTLTANQAALNAKIDELRCVTERQTNRGEMRDCASPDLLIQAARQGAENSGLDDAKIGHCVRCDRCHFVIWVALKSQEYQREVL